MSAIQKQLSLYGSFSYFSGNTSAKILNLVKTNDFLKFFIEKKKALKDNLQLHLDYVNGSNVETTDNKIHNFSKTKLGKRRRNMTLEPVDTIIIRAQQDFDIDGGLNPVQIQLNDEKLLNQLKKYKNVVYKITLLGMLFPASIKNNTNLIFISANNLSGVKKAILIYKTYNILAEIDVSKIKNWDKTKGQSIWVNVQFKDHKEINNNNHLCFPFITRSFSDITSFSIFFPDDQNKKIEFGKDEKKVSVFNFQIYIYLA